MQPVERAEFEGVDYGWVMQTTFVVTILVGAPIVAVLSAFVTLDSWGARAAFAIRVGAPIWFVTAVAVAVYAKRTEAGDGGVETTDDDVESAGDDVEEGDDGTAATAGDDADERSRVIVDDPNDRDDPGDSDGPNDPDDPDDPGDAADAGDTDDPDPAIDRPDD